MTTDDLKLLAKACREADDDKDAEIRRLRSDLSAQTDAHVEEENRLRGQNTRLREQLRVAREAMQGVAFIIERDDDDEEWNEAVDQFHAALTQLEES